MTSRMISIRVPAGLVDEIDVRAKAQGMSRSAWMIEAALKYEPVDAAGELDEVRARLDRLESLANLS